MGSHPHKQVYLHNFKEMEAEEVIQKTRTIWSWFGFEFWQEREDSNPRPLVLETSALARLSYAPALCGVQ